MDMFQSAPRSSRGANQPGSKDESIRDRFNPRPARLAGRTQQAGADQEFYVVSIRAPLVSRGELRRS